MRSEALKALGERGASTEDEMMDGRLQDSEVRAQQWRQTQQQLEKLLEDGEKDSEAEIQSLQETLCTRQVFNQCLFITVEFGCSGGRTETFPFQG